MAITWKKKQKSRGKSARKTKGKVKDPVFGHLDKASTPTVSVSSTAKTVEVPIISVTSSALAKVTVPEPDRAQLTSYLQTSTELAAKVQLIDVKDSPSLTGANDMLLQLKSAEKDLREKRDAVVRPIKKHAEFLDSLFKPGFERLETADRHLRSKVLAYVDFERRRTDKEKAELTERAAEAAAQGDNVTALVHATAAVSVEAPSRVMKGSAGIETTAPNVPLGQVSMRDITDFEVVDMGAIPHEYFTFDEKKVRSALRSGIASIPGLRIFKRVGLAVGGR